MRTHILSPSPDLAPYVENYVDMGITRASTLSQSHTLLPAPSTSIAIGYGDIRGSAQIENGPLNDVPLCSIAGYWSRPKQYHLKSDGGGGVFVVCFKPWGLAPFVRERGFDLGETTDRNVDLAHAFGSDLCGELFDRVQECGTTGERKGVVEKMLRRIIRMASHPDRPAEAGARSAVEMIAASGGTIRVGTLAEELGFGRKRLVRLFDREIGISPKRVARIIRFQRSLRILPASTSLAEAAHEIGYFDQAHFIREFRELSGRTPGDWLRTAPATDLGRAFSRSIRSSHLYNTIYE